ncbi:MAG: hypothetical protein CM15mP25_0960 [Gammaproteobacteria bacterium]|nr:MAG: hypothetical protein CM15mP25_0960 [Gammaproteobacteria bacterium]
MTDAAMPSQRRRARLVLILIAGIPLSMMLGATALWWAVEQGMSMSWAVWARRTMES